jgi:hypothetical protein
MRMLATLALSFSLPVASAAVVPTQEKFSPDATAIYRELLLNYPLEPGDLWEIDETTAAITVSPSEWGSERTDLDHLHFVLPLKKGRVLPTEVRAIADKDRVLKQIAARRKVLPASKRQSWQRPDGMTGTHLSLSEIAFDVSHRFAEVEFRAECHCIGGDGATALFEHTAKGWKLIALGNQWIG